MHFPYHGHTSTHCKTILELRYLLLVLNTLEQHLLQRKCHLKLSLWTQKQPRKILSLVLTALYTAAVMSLH